MRNHDFNNIPLEQEIINLFQSKNLKVTAISVTGKGTRYHIYLMPKPKNNAIDK